MSNCARRQRKKEGGPSGTVAKGTLISSGFSNSRSGLSLAEREVVQITAAGIHGCGFCVAGHTAVALKKAQLDPALVEAVRSQGPLSDPKLDAVARFAREEAAKREREFF